MAFVAVIALSGCIAGSPTPAPATSAPAATGSSTAQATAAPAATFAPSGTASDNLAYFSKIVGDVWAGPDQVAGRAYIDALVAGGFDKTAMQVTPDESTIGNPAESIEFSVRRGEQCLVGQVGPSIGSPVTAVMPVLNDGACLIGQTRAIDW